MANPKSTTTYYLAVTSDGGCITKDTVVVTVNKIKHINIQASGFFICNHDSVQLQVEDNYSDYQWFKTDSLGKCLSTNDSLIVYNSGKYYLIAKTKNGCIIYSDTVDVASYKTENTKINASSLVFCNSDSVRLYAQNNYLDYQWYKLDSSACLSTNDSLIVKKSGKYYFQAKNQYGCAVYSDTIDISNSNPHIYTNETSLIICPNDTSLLTVADGYYNYKWYKLDSLSCLSTNDSLEVNNDGSYYCLATDKYGCLAYSDTIKITAIQTSYLELISILINGEFPFGETYYPSTKCLTLEIKNVTNDTIVLNNAYLKYNVAFSIPQSQFSKLILPLAKDSIIICYSPTIIGKEYDTLELKSCNSIIIPINGLGTSEYYGLIKCQVPVQIIIDSLPNTFHQNITQPAPNPGTDLVKLSYENYIPNNESIQVEAKLYDIYGNIRSKAINNIKNTINKENGIVTLGEYIFDTKDINNGNYIIKITTPYNIEAFSVIILK